MATPTLAARLAQCLAWAQISAAEAARLAGLKRAAVGHYLSGLENNPKTTSAQALAGLFGVRLGWLLLDPLDAGPEPTRDGMRLAIARARVAWAESNPGAPETPETPEAAEMEAP